MVVKGTRINTFVSSPFYPKLPIFTLHAATGFIHKNVTSRYATGLKRSAAPGEGERKRESERERERERERGWFPSGIAAENSPNMAVAANSFDSWLSKKLQALNTDEGVFGSYIKGILEGDETEDEKTEALEGILAGITEDNISKHVTEILSAWAEWLPSEDVAAAKEPTEDVHVRLAKMLESQSLPTTTQRSYTEEEKRIREAILAQYSQMSDGEHSDGDGEEDGAAGGDCGIEKNTNAAAIVQQEREKREKAKLDSQKKKEKDKEDREKQKQLKEEKKEKRKTQKGERRR